VAGAKRSVPRTLGPLVRGTLRVTGHEV
jgi:hypothetical protein